MKSIIFIIPAIVFHLYTFCQNHGHSNIASRAVNSTYIISSEDDTVLCLFKKYDRLELLNDTALLHYQDNKFKASYRLLKEKKKQERFIMSCRPHDSGITIQEITVYYSATLQRYIRIEEPIMQQGMPFYIIDITKSKFPVDNKSKFDRYDWLRLSGVTEN